MGCGTSKGSSAAGPSPNEATSPGGQPTTPKKTVESPKSKESAANGDPPSPSDSPRKPPRQSQEKQELPQKQPPSNSPPPQPQQLERRSSSSKKSSLAVVELDPTLTPTVVATPPLARSPSPPAPASPKAQAPAVDSPSGPSVRESSTLIPLPTTRTASQTGGQRPSSLAGSFSLPPVKSPSANTRRPALQVPKFSVDAPLSCLMLTPLISPSSSELSSDTKERVEQLKTDSGAIVAAAAAHVRRLLCMATPPVQALLDAGLAVALVRCLREGPAEAKLDAIWSLINIASSPEYSHVEALCNAEAHIALLTVLGVRQTKGAKNVPGSGLLPPALAAAAAAAAALAAVANGGIAAARPPSAVAPPPPLEPAPLRELALWALGNIAGVIHPEYKTQTLAVAVLEAGALDAVLSTLSALAAESTARADSTSESGAVSESRPNSVSPLMRCAAWCLHNLAKHKREHEMVDAIPVATKLLMSCHDPEVLTCSAWVLAYLGSNEDNKSHLKQALPALKKLVPWVRDASTSIATPALLCVGTMCTGYMRALDYSGQVVEAGGVPAFLSYLQSGFKSSRRDMVMDALFALSNVAGGNNATVQALLDAGAFTQVMSLLRTAGEDEEMRMECLYVLTNAWDPLVGAELNTVKKLLDCGVLEELDKQLDATGPPPRLELLLKGLTDGLKRGQMVMTYNASMLLMELGREGVAAAPPTKNPVVELYSKLGTIKRIEALNAHADPEVAVRANGILTVLKFMS